MINYQCENCQEKHSFPDTAANKQANCKSCNFFFIIPNEIAEIQREVRETGYTEQLPEFPVATQTAPVIDYYPKTPSFSPLNFKFYKDKLNGN